MALKTSLVAYYTLEDANDDFGSYNLTNTGVTPFATAKIGKGADFTPNDSLNNNSVLGATSYPRSFQAWFKADTITGDDRAVISLSDGSVHYYILKIRDSDDHIVFRSNNNTQAEDEDTGITATTGTWYHVVFVQHSATTVSIYVNGTKTNDTVTNYSATVSQFYLGYLGRSSVWWFDGLIDEVGVWDRALSDAEVTELYNGGTGLSPLAGFKTATVNASDVPATATDFPSYVDLSRLGITTLAEAQSIRVYADSGKTTEWAREIVSATEMHVKIPSLTSTTEIFVEWDGVRADYAVTDTYGRNAVWSGYEHVYHTYEGSGTTATDSTGTTDFSFSGNYPAWATGYIGNGLDFDGTNDRLTAPFVEIANNYFFSAWIKLDSTTTARYRRLLSTYESTKTTNGLSIGFNDSTPTKATIIRNNSFSINATNSMTTDWTKLSIVIDSTNGKIYYGATQEASATFTASSGTPSLSLLGAEGNDLNTRDFFPGLVDEIRIATFSASANWITTEYNNQSDEATFWGTWSDVGGGANTTDFFIMA